MATTATPAAPVETPICQVCSDNSATSLEKIDAYIQERVAAAIDAEMKLRNRKPTAPPDQILRFTDALGRKFSFPFSIVKNWGGGMEDFINEAFQNVQLFNQVVRAGYYDLVSEGEVISASEWETTVKPGIRVTMHMWPMGKVASELRGPTSEMREPPSEIGVPLLNHPPSPEVRSEPRSLVVRNCDVVFPQPIRPPSPGVCPDARSWVIKDCDEGVEEEEEEPKGKKQSRFRRLIRWLRDLRSYNDVTDKRHLKIARLDLVHGQKTSDLGGGKEKD